MSKTAKDQTEVLRNLVYSEIVAVSDEIDSVPANFFSNLTAEQMEYMQKLDYCRQKLHDLLSLMKIVDTIDDGKAGLTSGFEESMSLEYTRNKIADALGDGAPLKKAS